MPKAINIHAREGCRDAADHISTPGARRRPVTMHRTGRRRMMREMPIETGSEASSWVDSASTRHTKIRCETGGNPVAILNRLVNTLQESNIPGPQLFRLQNEFSKPLGCGGQGNVRGLDDEVARQYQQADKRIHKIWPAEMIAIKQHMERKDGRAGKTRLDTEDLSARFRAAECEVLALSPGLFRSCPNIVKLVGWGLCLDTVEDPTSPCCGGLQLPLLVYERAEMNLEEFLAMIFLGRTQNGQSLVEEGFAGSLSQKSPKLKQYYWWPSRGRILSKSPQHWLGSGPDPYEIVRLLCIDVGHGLQSLHENNFVHGDLKPENVLIFKTGRKWVAKLCDFGCAVGGPSKNSGNAKIQIPHKYEYFGTPYWLPDNAELQSLCDLDSLRRCDIYVYGLLVWSAFCLRGKHPPTNPRLQHALDDVFQLKVKVISSWLPFALTDLRLCTQIAELLRETMVSPEKRSTAPWECLYRGAREGLRRFSKRNLNYKDAVDNNSPRSPVADAQRPGLHMTREMKAKYNEQSWWDIKDTQNHPSDIMRRSSSDSLKNHDIGPASSSVVSLEDNCLSMALFETPRRRNDAATLFSRLTRALRPSSNRYVTQYEYQDLYHLARFRSRVSLEWWTEFKPNNGPNILESALSALPPVDMSTLAWLCAGPVGRAEVKSLGDDAWDNILQPWALDESAKLDRFLLLFQFGAQVERKLTRAIAIIQNSGFKTIFSTYMASCRPEIIPTVMEEIAHRLETSRKECHISKSTFMYFTGAYTAGGVGKITPAQAETDLTNDHNDAAVRALWHSITPKGALMRRRSLYVPTERDPISFSNSEPRAALPLGWKVVENRHSSNTSPCFTDEFTSSVTLTKPKVSPIAMRQVNVGFLQHATDFFCLVDLLPCMRAGISQGGRQRFEKDLERRFPLYDHAWFATEWNMEPNTDDVLKELRPQRIKGFATLLGTRGLEDKMIDFIRMFIGPQVFRILYILLLPVLFTIIVYLWRATFSRFT